MLDHSVCYSPVVASPELYSVVLTYASEFHHEYSTRLDSHSGEIMSWKVVL